MNSEEAREERSRALGLVREGRYDEAVRFFNRLIAQDPDDHEIAFEKARCLVALERLPAAEAICTRLRGQFDDDRVETLWRQIDQLRGAPREFDPGPSDQGTGVRPLQKSDVSEAEREHYRALALIRGAQYVEALQIYVGLVAEFPENLEYAYRKAGCLVAIEHWPAAQILLNQLRDRFQDDRIERLMEKMEKMRPAPSVDIGGPPTRVADSRSDPHGADLEKAIGEAAGAGAGGHRTRDAGHPMRRRKSVRLRMTKEYGGIERPEFFFWMIVAQVLGAVALVLQAQDSQGVAFAGFIAALPVLFGAHIARLRNLGFSGWLSVLLPVPIVGYFLTVACLACPTGIREVRKLDRGGMIIAGIFIAGPLLLVAGIAAIALIASIVQ